ncbi:MAG: hypothetical protein ACO1SX_18965 [Actinomycetota bacterium]
MTLWLIGCASVLGPVGLVVGLLVALWFAACYSGAGSAEQERGADV